MGCSSDATTLEEFTENLVRIELRYSRACQAAWTRYEVYGNYNNIRHTTYLRGTQNTQYRHLKNLSGEKGWTAMIGFTAPAGTPRSADAAPTL